jgi:hypothetical protein
LLHMHLLLLLLALRLGNIALNGVDGSGGSLTIIIPEILRGSLLSSAGTWAEEGLWLEGCLAYSSGTFEAGLTLDTGSIVLHWWIKVSLGWSHLLIVPSIGWNRWGLDNGLRFRLWVPWEDSYLKLRQFVLPSLERY